MKSLLIKTVAAALCAATIFSCGSKSKRSDTTSSGEAVFVCDDCFSNVIQLEVDIFETMFENATLLPIYTDEAEAMTLLLQDSIRMVVASRDFTEQEKASLKAMNRQLIPRSQKIAVDGIALITHPDNPDTMISTESLRRIMSGESTTWGQVYLDRLNAEEIQVVFDHPNSSTARFIRDSICMGGQLSGRLRALSSSNEVLEYVSQTPGALGVIGVAWISNPHDSTHLSFTRRINVLSVSREHPATAANSYKPYPAYLHLRDYPLTRDIYVLLTDLRGTLPAGFTNFIAGDRGQRIILKAGLVPATMPIRTVVTRDHL